jgi:hypothetical protein
LIDYLIINKGNTTRINRFITIDRKALLCDTFQNFNGYLVKGRQVVSLFKSLQIIGSFLESKPLPFNFIPNDYLP